MRDAGGSRKLPLPADIEGWAEFSEDDDGDYRYLLGRRWYRGEGCVVFVGLNPSTADADADDPTVRKCWRWAKEWGFGYMLMLNAFAYRATNPSDLRAVHDPVGPSNHAIIEESAAKADLVIAAWGNGGECEHDVLMRLLRRANNHAEISCLGTTARDMPKHPARLRRDTIPEAWEVHGDELRRSPSAGTSSSQAPTSPAEVSESTTWWTIS